ncbi:MAG: hypothetical protein Q9181_006416 [Wetmoreana brouardii]
MSSPQDPRYNYQLDETLDVTDVRIDQLQDPTVFSMKSPQKTVNRPVECVFIALGWLVEHETVGTRHKPQEKMRTINYVVLSNLSTEPTSAWLTYDYHIVDFLEDKVRCTNRPGKYHNPLYARGGMERPFITEVKEVFHAQASSNGGSDACAKSDEYVDFRTKYTNLQDLCPTSLKQQMPGTPVQASYEKNSEALPNWCNRCCGLINHFKGSTTITEPPSKRSSPSSTDTPSDTMSSSLRSRSSTTSSVSNSSDCGCNNLANGHGKGFFGLHPFDLAVLAPDVAGWSIDGLNLEQTKKMPGS